MNQRPKYRTPVLGEELIKLAHENSTDARQYLELLELRHLLPEVRASKQVVPGIFLGLLDVSPCLTISDFYENWHYGKDARILLVSGHQEPAKTRHTLTVEKIRTLLPTGNESVAIYSQIVADNTPEQAKWLCEMAVNLGVEALALHAPYFHIPRAMATTIQVMVDLGIFLPVIPAPRLLEPDTSYPLAGFSDYGKNIELLPGEFKRFVDYRGKGVACYSDVDRYIRQLKVSLGVS